MQSLIVLVALVSELAGGQNDPPLVFNVTKNTLVLNHFRVNMSIFFIALSQ